MTNVYLVTQGDLFDYDAPFPSAIFLTEREAWKFVSDSVSFIEYANGEVIAHAEYYYIYEYPLGEEVSRAIDVRQIDIPGNWCYISKEIGRHWKP